MSAKRVFRFLAWCFAVFVVATQLAGCLEMDVSADGKQIVFPMFVPGEKPGVTFPTVLAVLRVSGGPIVTLPGTKEGLNPKWSPSSKWIAYFTEHGVCVYDISEQKVVKTLPGVEGFTWTKRDRLIGIRTIHGKHEMQAFWFDVGSMQTLWTTNLGIDVNIRDCTYLPNTDGVAFIGFGNVYTVERGQVQKITSTHDVVGLGISQDGNRLVWARDRLLHGLIALHEFNLQARSVRNLSFPSVVAPINSDPKKSPTWIDHVVFCPDLKRLMITCRFRSAAAHNRKAEKQGVVVLDSESTFAMNIDGSNVVPLDGPEASGYTAPTWSHDGQFMVSIGTHGKNGAMMIHSPDGHNPKPIPMSDLLKNVANKSKKRGNHVRR